MIGKLKIFITAIFLLFSLNGQTKESKPVKNHKPADKTHTNHLINENSPYLLSHAHNPVDWYPWSAEALEKAKLEDKPIFLSIGYAACHWCHVMERESFENDEIAAILNKHFISIKVDREQRPDLDQIYMSFTMAMTGGGGWPMSVFLTPALKPFYAGTYFPPDDRYGRPGFKKILTEINKAYQTDKSSIVQSSESIFNQLQARMKSTRLANDYISKDLITLGLESLLKNADNNFGGFGSAPKFPHALEISFFLNHYSQNGDKAYLNVAEKSLTAMANGGIYDHLGGGFARYSTDMHWLVPHFEKMLYDNSLLVSAYSRAYRITGNKQYREVVNETLDFILKELTDKSGGFYSTLDADSEGEEGKFYVWSKDEIEKILGTDNGALFNRYYGVTPGGNFEGKNILNRISPKDFGNEIDPDKLIDIINQSKVALLNARSKRIRPGTDDKILSSWNGLALSAFCAGYQISSDERYLRAAIANAEFISKTMIKDKKLIHAYRDGRFTEGEFLEDYAFYIAGLLALYETDLNGNNLRWLNLARTLADRAIEIFVDQNGAYYLRPDSLSDLIIRPSDENDGATPAPGSIMIQNLLKLNRITDDKKYLAMAEKNLQAISGRMKLSPGGMTSALVALDYYYNDKIEIVITGQGAERDKMIAEIYKRYIPNRVLAVNNSNRTDLPLFEHRLDEKPTAYVCVNSVCNLPVTTTDELIKQLSTLE